MAEQKKEDNQQFKLFREKSLESIESPESLNDYLQVTSPGVWLILAAVIAILVGAVLWSIFGRIQTSINVAVQAGASGSVCVVPYDSLQGVMDSGVVEVNDNTYALQLDAETETVIISESTNPYLRVAGGLHVGDIAVEIPMDFSEGLPLSAGIYTGTVVTESLQPISLLLQ